MSRPSESQSLSVRLPGLRPRLAAPAAALFLVALLAIVLVPAPARGAGMLIADGGLGGALEVVDHDVRVTVNNGVAVTHVTQVFRNTEDRIVEALYTFPVPRGASVANFSMWIDGREMVGEVVEKQRAREIYDSYKRQKRDPGLLEQTDYRTFEMRIFPIAPRAEQRVQVSYYQELDFDHDRATYVYPLATTTRRDLSARTTGRFSLNVDVRSAVPIVEMDSPSHKADVAVAKHGEAYYQASYEAQQGDLNRDVVLAFQTSRPTSGLDLISTKQKGEDGYFCLLLTAGEELGQQDAAMDYVFVLDVSGSMGQDGKLDLSRQSLRAFVDALGAEDRFEMVAFNVAPATSFGALRGADEANKAEAATFLDSQQARGGTVLNPAMTLAYKYADASGDRPLNVIILSDGLTEQAERAQLAALIRQRPAGSRVFCIGVGNDVNRGLLEQLANDSGGLAAFVSREDNLQRQAAAFRRKLLRPVATDLKIDFRGIEVYDVEPRQLPNLYHGAPVRLYGRYKGGGNAAVTLAANVQGRPISTSVSFDLPKEAPANTELERMWAWKRVDRLLKEADAAGARSAGVTEEIVRLGEGYSIATEYTSFIVLENDGEYQRWKIDRRNALRLARDREGQAEVASQLEKLRTARTDQLGPAPVEAAAKQVQQVVQNVASPAAQPGASDNGNQNGNNNGTQSRDFSFGNGGGAIDPISGSIVVGLGAVALRSLRRKAGRR